MCLLYLTTFCTCEKDKVNSRRKRKNENGLLPVVSGTGAFFAGSSFLPLCLCGDIKLLTKSATERIALLVIAGEGWIGSSRVEATKLIR